MALQPYRDEQLNFFKYSSLVLNEFPRALRQSFEAMWDNNFGHSAGFQLWDDSPAVRNSFASKEGSRTKVPVHLSYNEWDCTALFQATIYAQSFATHYGTLSDVYVKPRGVSHGYFHPSVESPSGNNAETFALAIDQLRLLRNSLCHSTSSEMDKGTFDHRIKQAKDAFTALGVTTDPIDAVGGLSESDFPTNEVRKLNQNIKEETLAYIKILEGVIADMEDVKRNTASKEDIVMLVQKIDELKTAQDKRDTQLKFLPGDFPSALEEENSGTADIYHSLGDTQHAQGDYPSALESAKRALSIRLKLFGEEHPSTADIYHSLGDTERALGDHSSALESAKRALSIRLKLFGEEHPSTTDIYHSLGDTQRALCDYSSALESAKRALSIRLKLFGEEHPSTADIYHSLGDTQRALGDYPSALESAKRALSIRLKLFGEEHPSTADIYHSLGDTQRALCDYSSALESAKRALSIRLKLFGEEHSSTADSYHSLGDTQRAIGDLPSALQSHQRSQKIRNKLFGKEPSNTADS